MIKALFFDIDGTLVSFKTHRIPASAIDAIKAAKAKGVEIYISTGRPYAMINNIDEIKPLINGYITTNGAYCFSGNHIISCSPILDSTVRRILTESDEKHFACIVVGEKDVVMYNPNEEAEHLFKDMLDIKNYRTDIPIDKVLDQPILQLTPFITDEQEKELLPFLPGIESSRWYPAFADFTAKGISKAIGLKEIAQYRGFDITETMAFGDGGNDLTIVEAAGIGVAMGNANEILKAHADYITTSVDDDGIANALRHYLSEAVLD